MQPMEASKKSKRSFGRILRAGFGWISLGAIVLTVGIMYLQYDVHEVPRPNKSRMANPGSRIDGVKFVGPLEKASDAVGDLENPEAAIVEIRNQRAILDRQTDLVAHLEVDVANLRVLVLANNIDVGEKCFIDDPPDDGDLVSDWASFMAAQVDQQDEPQHWDEAAPPSPEDRRPTE